MVDKRGVPRERSELFKLNLDGARFASLSEFLPSAEIMTSVALMEGRDGVFYGTSAGLVGKADGMVFRVGKDGSGFRVLHRFSPTEGADFRMQLTEGKDGWLCGVAPSGGASNAGTIFKLAKDGAGFAVLRHLTGKDGDGKTPNSRLVSGPDGALYGTTDAGGTRSAGTVFRINPDGNGYAVLHRFTGRFPSGAPRGLILASDGVLYGTTCNGARGLGTVFRLNLDGTGFTELRSFQGGTNDGRYPEAPVAEGPDGVLYGTTNEGGDANLGTVFKLNKDGRGYAVLWRFQSDNQDGQRPRAVLLDGGDGALYGTTRGGGHAGVGTVFRLGSKR
jgi:uncharacterized repeat protein (TIGR03803 family)